MKISVVTTLFNAKETVIDCLNSVASQTYRAREHIVIDGGSEDGSLTLLKERGAQLAFLVSEPDEGTYFGLNKGIQQATGEVVGLLHADDVYADEGVLSRVAEAFSEPSVQAVYGDLQYVSRTNPGHVIRNWRASEFQLARLRWGWMPPHPTLFLRRSLYERFGLFDTSYRVAADYDLMLRILTGLAGINPRSAGVREIQQSNGHASIEINRAGPVCYLPNVLVHMRMGGLSNRSLRTVMQKTREDYRALRSNGVGGLGALICKNISKLPQFIRH